jgi:hypothetical protein
LSFFALLTYPDDDDDDILGEVVNTTWRETQKLC